MKPFFYLVPALMTIFSSGCSTGASDLRLSDVPKDNGVFMGHIDFYNGTEKIDGSSSLSRCYVRFENEKGDTLIRISTDESSWIFASAPIGRVYLSYVECNVGFLKGHPELETRELSFPVVASNPTYFGHMSIYFKYHGFQVLGMFGAIGGAIDYATSSKEANEMKIENKVDQAKLEYEKRYGGTDTSVKIIEAVIEKPVPKPSPAKM
jgi:hypothetical protein